MTYNPDSFASLCEKAKKIALFQGVRELLSWDQETVMPEKASQARGEQIAMVSGLIHSMKVDEDLYQLVLQVYHEEKQKIAPSREDNDRYIIAKRMKRDIEKAKLLTQDFVERFANTTSQAMIVWQRAKEENNWKLFAPHLQQVVDLSKEKAAYLSENSSSDPYSVLADEFEPEIDLSFVDSFFSELKQELVPLYIEIMEEQKRRGTQKPKEPVFSLEIQKKMAKELISRIGYDWTKSRLDESAHPFSMAIHPSDSRITIRSGKDESLISQLMSALHEAGHSLYEMGLPIEFYGTPLAEPVSLSIHESQSRLWETVIGRSRRFMPILADVINAYRKPGEQEIDLTTLYDCINWVEPSYIRTEADEVTYPLHVILRYEIEKELFQGDLQVLDIPQKWNSLMKELLGITPPNDTLGCLQDIHWSMGAFGYFPTYTLGSWYAICLYTAMEKQIPSCAHQLDIGNFSPVHEWLSQNIWSQGRRYLSQDLITRILGRTPQASDYLQYLREKYLS